MISSAVIAAAFSAAARQKADISKMVRLMA
jgi:hypothetical protein